MSTGGKHHASHRNDFDLSGSQLSFYSVFSEDHNVDIAGLDIAVNAVATAVKDFFFKRLPPVLPEEQMTGMLAHSYHHQDFFKWATRIMKYKGMKNKGMIDNLPSF